MKTTKLNKNSKVLQTRMTKRDIKADLITYILDYVGYLRCKELEEMLWKLAK